MKLQMPFLQLPVSFDAQLMADEITALGEAAWRPHPQGFAGNWGLPLLAVNGDPDDDRTAGPMCPTPYLERCPYTAQVLASLGAVWGRTRFMRLDGNAEVSAHVDNNYYWRERVRVHVPVVTRADVRFECGEAAVNMAAGECWIFDTWRRHRVLNPSLARRIHLVADTVGSGAFWDLASGGRRHDHVLPQWSPRHLAAAAGGKSPALLTEAVNRPEVMSPWELKDALGFVLTEASAHPALAQLQAMAGSFAGEWHALWSRHGAGEPGKPAFRAQAQRFDEALLPFKGVVALRNGVDLVVAIRSLVLMPAVRDADLSREPTEPRETAISAQRPAASPAVDPPTRANGGLSSVSRQAGADPVFDRPVFVVSAPRSGSTMLFQALLQARGLYTLGRENYSVLEGLPALHPRARDFASNRLDADDASDEVIVALRQRYFDELRDRDGEPPHAAPLRMMDKTPKNSLRVAFLARVFPEARFVFLQRDPRQVLSSMIEAWQSGRFGTYPGLPGWTGPPWSLLLVPGWRELRGRPLPEIVATQWQRTLATLLDDLQALPPGRVSVVAYDALHRAPQDTLATLCAGLGMDWDRSVGAALPLSRNTVTAPHPDKWRRHAAEIQAVWPTVAATVQRMDRFTAA